MPPEPEAPILLATGSIAAVKVPRLLAALGGGARLFATAAARAFLPPGTDAAEWTGGDAGPLLVAPASAEFMRRAAAGEVSFRGPVMLAPAMNAMMWAHPAVQAHARALHGKGFAFAGPAFGGMACGDAGFGRMLEPEEIAAAFRAFLGGGKPGMPQGLVEKPRLPGAVRPGGKNILLVNGTQEDARVLMTQGFRVQAVVPPERAGEKAAFRRLTGLPAASAHYDIYREGMDHIWLAEDSDALALRPQAGLEDGEAASFIGCVYLASKRPVLLLSHAPALEGHGAIRAEAAEISKRLDALPAAMEPDIRGLSVLVTGGSVRERVDAFRFYADTSRPAEQGRRFAGMLKARGADVVLVEAMGSTADLLSACTALKGKAFGAVVQLAAIPELASPAPAAGKISKSGPERELLYRACGNAEALEVLRGIFGAGVVLGHTNGGGWSDRAQGLSPAVRQLFASLARRAQWEETPCA